LIVLGHACNEGELGNSEVRFITGCEKRRNVNIHNINTSYLSFLLWHRQS